MRRLPLKWETNGWNRALKRHWRILKWWGWGSLATTLTLTVAVVLGLVWLIGEYTRYRPLELTRKLPQIHDYLAKRGLNVTADSLQLYFENGLVVKASGLGVRGKDGVLGVYVEQAGIKISLSKLLFLTISPKVIEAKGVTLRLVRDLNGIGIAGLPVEGGEGGFGAVDWLNGLRTDRQWGRIRSVKVADLQLLVRDDIQQAEWVLENGNLALGRNGNRGETGSLTGVVRRLYGGGERHNDVVPVMVRFRHPVKTEGLDIRAQLGRADVAMVEDYLPPQFKDLLKAEGEVEVGTRLLSGNKLEQPWVTLRLNNVSVQPPKGFSEPLNFPQLTVTANYVPLVAGVSGSDVLYLREVVAKSKRGNVWRVSGTVSDLTTEPVVNMSLASDEGDVQGVFDLFPDKERGFQKALKWLRPNLMEAEYRDLRAHYVGVPSKFKRCGDNCGLVEIDATFDHGKVRFLPELTPAAITSGTFTWRGQKFSVTAPVAKFGAQSVSNVAVTMDKIFDPPEIPIELRVSGTLSGELNGLVKELAKLEEADKVPTGASGRHVTDLGIFVPMPHGITPTFALSTVLVSSSISNLQLKDMPELQGEMFRAPRASFWMAEDKTVRLSSDGVLGSNPVKIDWMQNIMPGVSRSTQLSLDGTLDGAWLLAKAGNPKDVSLTGPVRVAANLAEKPGGGWRFGVKADAARAAVGIGDLNYTKASGGKMDVVAQGESGTGGALRFTQLQVHGAQVNVSGVLVWNPLRVDDTVAKFNPLQVGETSAVVDYARQRAVVNAKTLDLRGLDLFGSGTSKAKVQNLNLQVKAGRLLTGDGRLDSVEALLDANKGRWDIQRFTAMVDGNSAVNVRLVPLRGQPGRRRLTLNADDLGRTLTALGIYDKLKGGKLAGDITYDAPNIGGGLLKLDNFELRNPPTLVKLLSLLSLEQLLSGTDSTLFSHGTIPVRIDGDKFYLDKANFDGPSMSVQLTGEYDRGSKEMNIDGRLAPAIPLNRLVTKIPLLGNLLAGSQNGVVVADFKLKGPSSDPQVNVRPLSVFTPGLLKDFWRGLTGGGPSNPPPRVIDGRSK